MQLFYHPDLNESTTSFTFNKEESRHITKVLRKNIGDAVHITNGNGLVFTGEITDNNIKSCTCSIIKIDNHDGKDYYLHMAVAPTKMNDRYEWFLEKAVEIGVDEITPVICDHSERKVVKPERFEKIIQSAMKQSLQSFLPKLNEAVALKAFLTNRREGQLFIAHCEENEKYSLKEKISPKKTVTILIGPEGDFSGDEIMNALDKGFIPVSLGSNRLRTETAAIVACHTVALINE